MTLTANYHAITQNKLLLELKDLVSFSIPCIIGIVSFERVMCDLRENVSLMPLSICKKLNLGTMKSINISLQLKNRIIKYLVRKIGKCPHKNMIIVHQY